MSAWVCRACSAAYSVGAPKCPQCGSPSRIEEEEQNMPKATVHGGASDATFDEGSEQPSPTPEAPGTSSSTSSEKAPPSPETSESAPAKPARTTGSRSAKARTGSSSARGTAGAQTAPTSDDAKDEG